MSAPVLSLHVVSEPPSALFVESRTVDAVDDVLACFRADGFDRAAVIGEMVDGASRVEVA